jgi:hypothetical protein
MVSTSFRARCRDRVYPRFHARKRLAAGAAAFAVAVTGCGGGSEKPAVSRVVSFRGASFEAPAAWRLTRTPTTLAGAPSGESDELVSVSVF